MSALLDDIFILSPNQPNNENVGKTRKSHLSWVESSHLFVSVDNLDILPAYSGGGGGLAWPPSPLLWRKISLILTSI